jgi:type IV pilus biogenesis protein PilP
MRNRYWLALAATTLVHALAQAETPAQQLTRIESETAVLKARARKAEVQAQIAGKRAEIAARNAEARRVNAAPPPEMAVLRGVEGVGDAMYATLELPHRGTVDVAAGDRLPDGSKVLSIRHNEVVIQSAAGHKVTLGGAMISAPLTGRAPAFDPTRTASALPALPQLPPLPQLPDYPAPKEMR